MIFEGEGGTVLTNRDLMSRVSSQRPVLLLETGPDSWSLFSVLKDAQTLLGRYWFDKTWSSQHQSDPEREDIFKQICSGFQVGLVHFRHLMGLSPEIASVPKELQIPVIYSIHDYYPFCPTINLIDSTDQFCRADCRKNYASQINCADCQAPSIWGVTESFGGLRHKGVLEWRQRFQQTFDQCDAIVSTSSELKKLFAEIFPDARSKLRIIEHGRDLERHDHGEHDKTEKKPLPIAFIGHLTEAKGAKLIGQLLDHNVEAGEPFVFHFFGWIDPSFSLPETGMVAHGKYQREELPELLAEVHPTAILIPSIWPETFCHTLTEAWANGIPVLATNLGALKERIETHGGGWLLEPHDSQEWWKILNQCLEDPDVLKSKRAEITSIPFRSTDDMARD